MTASLDAFFAARDWPTIVAATGWTISRDGDDPQRVFFETTARDGERYRLLLLCDGYPGTAPSVAFVNMSGSKADPSAWPSGDDFFFQVVKPPPNSFLCMPLTREGLTHHREWASSPDARSWRGEVNSLIDLFNYVQRLLNDDHYLGRGR